ncbi:hypothetical protein HK102_008090 [Quaeritorhiza haematococci]|nr:hypothetical protein HK102_008090 [Quaeritorhiza haematococci]
MPVSTRETSLQRRYSLGGGRPKKEAWAERDGTPGVEDDSNGAHRRFSASAARNRYSMFESRSLLRDMAAEREAMPAARSAGNLSGGSEGKRISWQKMSAPVPVQSMSPRGGIRDRQAR